ncbi:hypothetical protein Pan216_10480 [Planctomycetes bacterium Pan216]|uniref:Uncharacterized protein n=1 Tax=Kolteria novifilia TaxID=2527975 RepID=A0A518AZR7_9BACT|nr:hypothetical protein Pan216_10480 [Planctomycetes bacterium Pan216]
MEQRASGADSGADRSRATSAARQRRFLWRVTGMALLFLPLVVLLQWGTIGQWIGSTNITLRFQILDRATGKPLPGAKVTLADGYDHRTSTSTNRDGIAEIEHRFVVKGNHGLFFDEGLIEFRSATITIEADGFVGRTLSLDQYFGSTRGRREPLSAVQQVDLQPNNVLPTR